MHAMLVAVMLFVPAAATAAGSTFAVVQQPGGKTIYIAPGGDDAANGLTPATAMATLESAQWRAGPGDTIEIAGGTYRWTGGTWLGIAGTPTNWIVVRARLRDGRPEKVVIQGDGQARERNYCLGTGGDHLDIRNLGCNDFAEFAVLIYGGHHVRLAGMTLTKLGNSGIAVYSDREGSRQAYEVLIENNRIVDTNRRWLGAVDKSGWGQGISMFGDRITVRGNQIGQTRGEGIGIAGVDNRVVANTVRDSCSVGIYLDTTSRSLIERNFVIQGKTAAARAFFATCQQSSFSNGAPLFGTGIQIASETSTYTALPQERLVGNTIRNNIVVNTRIGLAYGSYGFDAGGGDGMTATIIVNNSFVDGVERAVFIETGLRSQHRDTVIANNIFYWPSGNQQPSVLITAMTGLAFSSNLWSGIAAGSATGSGDVNADPRFTDVAGATPPAFRPVVGSPAQAAGNPAYRPTLDFYGQPRTGPSVDMGALIVR